MGPGRPLMWETEKIGEKRRGCMWCDVWESKPTREMQGRGQVMLRAQLWRSIYSGDALCGYVTTSSSPYLLFLLSLPSSLFLSLSLCVSLSLFLSLSLCLSVSLSHRKMFCYLIVGTNIIGCWALLDFMFSFQVEKKESVRIFKTVSIIS